MRGRPTKYTPELLEKAWSYVDGYKKAGDEVPSDEGFARYLEISTTTLYDWAKHEDKKEFSDILGHVSAERAKQLINKGLSGDFNSAITKLLLTKHGYSDKQETVLDGKLKIDRIESVIIDPEDPDSAGI